MIRRPTRAELLAARGEAIPPVIAPGLRVLFCGINPSLYSAAVGHHFAGPSNRFWKVLSGARITPRLFSYADDRELLEGRCGVTNLVNFATARADELSTEQLLEGGRKLRRTLARYRPAVLAVVGMGAYRVAMSEPRAVIGEQPARIADTRVWVLPNPSGLNANYQLPQLIELYREAYEAADGEVTRPISRGPKPRRRRGTT